MAESNKTKIELSKEDKIKIIKRCMQDPVFFIENFCTVSHPMRGAVPFKLYPFQKDCIKEFQTNRFNIVLKSRQLGLSTVTAAYVAWLMLFREQKAILTVATKLGTAANLVKKVKFMMKQIPSWLLISPIAKDNANIFELGNGSFIKAASTSSDAGRSEALSLLVIDEAALIEGLDELWAGLYPTITTGGSCIAISSPKGIGNWFHKTWVDAEKGENDFNTINLPWQVHPERDDEWFRNETKNFSVRYIAQEYECNFDMSGDTFLDTSDILWMESLVKEPKYKTGQNNEVWIWQTYDPTKKYFMTSDVSRGDGADNSTFLIFEQNTFECVAEFYGKAKPDILATYINQFGREYGNALSIVESNSYGDHCLTELEKLGYPNIYYSYANSHEIVDPSDVWGATDVKAGLYTSAKVRLFMISKLEEYIRNKHVLCYSSRLMDEMKKFIWKNGKAQSTKTAHDDLIMSLAMAAYIKDMIFRVNITDIEYDRAALKSVFVSSNKMVVSMPGQIQSGVLDRYGNIIMNPKTLQTNKSSGNMRMSRQIFIG